ncbi:MAG: ABC transporter substrate-binding protein [Candidatus Binatota bacterium]|nr:ABC transporter substrate-binding protein [Candidatus Binatota bacterium]
MTHAVHQKNSSSALALISFILLAALFCTASRASAQGKVRFPVSVASKTVGFSPIWAVAKQGFLDRRGLQVEVVLMRGAEKAALALVGDSVYVGLGSADAFISAVESNFNVAIVGGIINRPSFVIMARKNIKSYQELRGATIGVTNVSSGPAVALRYVLKAKGLEYPRDYKLIPAGPDIERTMSLSAGRLDASPLGVPTNFMAEEMGYSAIGSYLDVIDYQVSVFAVNRAWAEKNRALLTRFLKGMVLGMRWYLENKEAAIDFLVTDLKLKPEHARRGWEFYKEKGLWNPQIELNFKGMNTTIQIYNEANPAKPATSVEKYVDRKYLNEALKELN